MNQELTAGLNWRTTRRASSSAWYSTMPTLLCDFTMSQRRCLPAPERDLSWWDPISLSRAVLQQGNPLP